MLHSDFCILNSVESSQMPKMNECEFDDVCAASSAITYADDALREATL